MKIRNDVKPGACTWAVLGSHAPKTDDIQRSLVSAMFERVQEYSHRNSPSTFGHGTYLSHSAIKLIRFAQASAKYDQSIVREEAAKIFARSPERHARRWIIICLGYGQSPEVLNELEEIVRDAEGIPRFAHWR